MNENESAQPESECSARAIPLPSTVLSVANSDDYSAHPITQTHECTGEHSCAGTLEFITHHCECDATFFFMDDALNAIIKKLESGEAPRKLFNDSTVNEFDRTVAARKTEWDKALLMAEVVRDASLDHPEAI